MMFGGYLRASKDLTAVPSLPFSTSFVLSLRVSLWYLGKFRFLPNESDE
jgi:hypothetical protein